VSLAQVQFPAPTPQGLEEWGFAHWQHHQALLNRIEQVHGVRLPMLQIYPLDFDDQNDVQIFLQSHQSMHNDLGLLLGVQGNDLANVDFTNKDQREMWMFYNLQAHRAAAEALEGGI